MLLKEILRMAFSSLGVNKLRSALTMAGITIGVFSVIGVMTTVSAMRGGIESALSFLGSNMFQLAKYPNNNLSSGTDWRKIEQRPNVTYAQAQRVKQLMEGVSDVVCFKTFYQNGPVQATYGGRKTEPGLTFGGTNQYFVDANQFSIDSGRNLTQEDVDLGRPVMVIGQTLVKKLFPAESPFGKMIKLAGRTYTVVGIFAEKGTLFGQSQDDICIVPITRFLSDFGSANQTVNIAIQAPSQEQLNWTVDKAITAMRIARGLKPGEDNNFEQYSNDSLIAAFASVADAVSAGALVISGIALLAASIGIMNIMLVSVTERTKEIGIRKSIGARSKSILIQFLIEAVTISLIGGIAGIALGVIVGDGLALWMNFSIVFPWNWAMIGLVVCSAIGIGAGLYPAMKAASLDPIESLRFE